MRAARVLTGWPRFLPWRRTSMRHVACKGIINCQQPRLLPGPSWYVVAGRGRQKCSDLLELRPDFDGGTGPSACDPHRGRNRGSVLSVHLAWPPPKPPQSALLQLALSFTTDAKVHRMNWVSNARHLPPNRPLACALCPSAPPAPTPPSQRAAVGCRGRCLFFFRRWPRKARLCNGPTLTLTA